MSLIETQSLLSDLNDAVLELYDKQLHGNVGFLWGTQDVNKMFSDPITVHGEGLNMHFHTGMTSSVRAGGSPNADIEGQEEVDIARVAVRFSETDPTASDFTRLTGSAKFSDLDLTKAIEGPNREASVFSMVDGLNRQLNAGFPGKLAEMRLSPSTGKIGEISGVITITTTSPYYSAGAGAPTSVSTAHIKLSDNYSISYFARGRKIDIFDSAGANKRTVIVTSRTTGDNSFTVRTADGLNFATAAYSGGAIYDSTEQGIGMKGPASFYVIPASGDSYIGGKDRTSVDFRWMLPTTYRAVASGTTTISRVHLEETGNLMDFAMEENESYTAYMGTKIYNRLRADIGQEGLVYSQDKESPFPVFGNKAVGFVHPKLGTVELMADPKRLNDSVWLHNRSTWKTYAYGRSGIRFLPGNVQGIFSRIDSTTPGSGPSLFYTVQAIMLGVADVCHMPYKNGLIANLSA
jgi:hypothetical protein